MKRAYYSSSIYDFCQQTPEQILGQMAHEHSFDLTPFQRDAWVEQTRLLKEVLYSHKGKLYFEFSIPRMGKRIDAVVIIGPAIFVIEFKVGESAYNAADLDQVMDYALDLHNFHEGSHYATLVPILVATKAKAIDNQLNTLPDDRLFLPVCCNSDNLDDAIDRVLNLQIEQSIKC